MCRSVNVTVEKTVLAPLATATPIKTFASTDIVSEPSSDQGRFLGGLDTLIGELHQLMYVGMMLLFQVVHESVLGMKIN